jgi:membrane-bound lytic murein transglycosylase MltF
MHRILLLITLIAAGWVGAASGAQPQAAQKPAAQPVAKGEEDDPFRLPDITAAKWTGDLDGMIQRRVIRVLVPYSKVWYFVDRGTQRGLAYDAARIFEDELNKKLKNRHVRVHAFFIPVSRDEMVPGLVQGRGDLAIGNLTITADRKKQVDFSIPNVRNVSEIVVSAPGAPACTKAEDLSGREVYVRPSSSYMESLKALNERLAKAKKAPVKIRPAPETLEDDDILEMVAAGLVEATVVDQHMAEFWVQVFPKLVLNKTATLRTGGEVAWMFRKNSPKLKAELDTLLSRYGEGSTVRNQLLQKYLKSTKWVKSARSSAEMAKFQRTVEIFRKYSNKYELDYLLMMAEGYQESGLNQEARSPVGAIGVMQVMPPTGKDMNVGDITQIDPNIHAGVKYIRFMMNQFFANEPMTPLNKGLFTFAAYNCGPGRIKQLRAAAAKRGLDPNKWFNNVELIAAERIGRETVQYVSNIYKYYLAYQMVVEQQKEREAAKPPLKK